ncbi:MAG: C40 family peptidase [Bacteroidota bacterium]
MKNNAFRCVLLLLLAAIFLASCSSANRTYRSDISKNTTRKSTERGERKQLRKSIVKHSKKYVGIPYKYAGKTPKTGFDCSGFTAYVFKKFNIEISTGSRYQARTGREIPLKRAKPGDLLFFGKGRKVTHVALVTRNTREGIEVIHSTSSRGIMVQNVSKSSYWKPKILFARDVITR